MDKLKIEYVGSKVEIEGELDIEFEFSGIHPGFPQEDEDIFNKSRFEIMIYGEILNTEIAKLIEWINRKSKVSDPAKFPNFKIIINRTEEDNDEEESNNITL